VTFSWYFGCRNLERSVSSGSQQASEVHRKGAEAAEKTISMCVSAALRLCGEFS
jgi:hypothetical protein